MRLGRQAYSRWLGKAFDAKRRTSVSGCQVLPDPYPPWRQAEARRTSHCVAGAFIPPLLRGPLQVRHTHAEARAEPADCPLTPAAAQFQQPLNATRTLPSICHGCGAFSQTSDPDRSGYFDLDRKTIKQYLGLLPVGKKPRKSDLLAQDALQSLNLEKLGHLGLDLQGLFAPAASQDPQPAACLHQRPPLCERCHKLVHHHSGTPIFHPSIASLRDTISESPYKYNHIYHVLDAADFPMSLLPRINKLLDVVPLRSRNRRSSKVGEFHHGRKTELTFVITRSDLLAPKKEQVDSLMPYLRELLRDGLVKLGRDVRLGNVRCVSAKRSWWTKELREDIWSRGGAGWMVGKVNVGKSQLFEAVYPKGRMNGNKPTEPISVSVFSKEQACVETTANPPETQPRESHHEAPVLLDEIKVQDASLLPPARPETDYPEMPLVSSLPGTTASPIRVPFGNGKGELIDLPGLSRGDLERHVKEEERVSLILRNRRIPEQQVLKPGRSLLLGGFIRITPTTPDLIFLAYNFTMIKEHVSATYKAIALQEQRDDAPNVENISVPGTGKTIKLAGTFQLKYDVSKTRTGPLTRKNAVNLKVDCLPYRVLAVDILIEGCGWVELVAQVRTRQLFAPRPRTKSVAHASDRLESLDLSEAQEDDTNEHEHDAPNWPEVEVHTPEGRFVACRRPMNAWLLNKPKQNRLKGRPRKSMKGAKKEAKRMRRATMLPATE